jgi:tRNA threonylcarbamoyladenosine dehydratase
MRLHNSCSYHILLQVHLLASCYHRKIPVLCVGGAGAKADPTKLCFADIQEASVDPLVRAVRHQLRRKHNISAGIPVLLSTERPRCGLVTTKEQQQASSIRDFQVSCNCCQEGLLGI